MNTAGADTVALLRRLWRTSLIVTHLSSGLVLLVVTGAVWRPHSALVRKTKKWWLSRIPEILGMQISVNGTLPQHDDQPLLLVSNHVSWIDIPLIGGVTPTCFISKAEVARWPVIGTLAAKAGTLFIRRGSGDTDTVALTMADTLKQRRSILFFPEGTTTDGSTLKRLHTKLFKVCQHHPVTVQPVVIRYWTLAGENPVPFIGDDEFTRHLWNMMGHPKLFASIKVLPRFQLEPETMYEQISRMENAMRNTLDQYAPRQTQESLHPTLQESRLAL
jgi:1-acyl-sn-glycerol-3-phosphate acyltransferase